MGPIACLEKPVKKYHYSLGNVQKSPVLKFHEVRLVGADLFHAEGRKDRQTDRQGE